MTVEFDFLQTAVAVELDREMNLVAARRIISVHLDRSIWQFAKISRTTGMIEDHFLIKFFEIAKFRIHLKN